MFARIPLAAAAAAFALTGVAAAHVKVYPDADLTRAPACSYTKFVVRVPTEKPIPTTGVRVLVVRPGFVKSRMTNGVKPAPFATTPEVVASATVAALNGRAGTIWVPGRLRLIFAILRHLPRSVYRRLPL